ncbi:hypothetical protein BDV35DRAFT_152415 [Aspergillus flavus]|uniref:Uncharacterized protein n=1 Tax=Aspergillus flavus TaxID=5059 RepID=A0A5N6H423_ASPFL|nr:hypothetical protein BDV35DRAFT_152415 [Aspergillus flavus]
MGKRDDVRLLIIIRQVRSAYGKDNMKEPIVLLRQRQHIGQKRVIDDIPHYQPLYRPLDIMLKQSLFARSPVEPRPKRQCTVRGEATRRCHILGLFGTVGFRGRRRRDCLP